MATFKSSVLVSAFLYFVLVSSHISRGRDGHGLIGYGISMYEPLCAYTCRDVLSASMLNCSEQTHMHGGMVMKREMEMDMETSPECYASDHAFLYTLAYCMSTHCQDVAVWDLEKYWNMNVAGRHSNQPVPKATYQETLADVITKPNDTLVVGEELNHTMIISDEDYRGSYNAQRMFEKMEKSNERYG